MQNQLPTSDQLIQLIQDVLSGDNQKIQHASLYLKTYLKTPESVGLLTLILSQNNQANIRLLAGVLLKRGIQSTFEALEQQSKKELQMILLERFFAEELLVIRKQLGGIIGNIAHLTLPKNEWPELMVILGQQTDQNQPLNRRKSGLELLGFILEYSGDSLVQHYGSFYNFFKLSIQDANKNIRIETVKCLISLFDNIGYMTKEHTVLFKDLIPPIVQIVDSCIAEEDEDTVKYCLDAFNYLADSKLTILDDHFLLILQFLASEKVLLNKKLSKNLKASVMDIIQTISMHHKGVFNKNTEIMKSIIHTLSIIISQPFTAEDLEDNENEESLQDVGLWLIQNLSLNLNKKKIYGILIDVIQKLIDTNDPNQQNSGFSILAYMCEGLSDQLERNLQNPIMNCMVPTGLKSPHPEVRGAVIRALSYFAEYMPDAICTYHAQIIPAMIQSFNDINIKVAEKSLFTLDIFCDVMLDDIVPYLEMIVPHVLQVPYNQNATIMMKRAAISTLASCISSSKEAFKVYLDRSYQTLHLIIQLQQTPENLGLVAEGVTALGQIANTFCKLDQQVYNIVIAPCLEHIYQMLINNKDYEIREGCFSFFYNLAEGIGKDFEPFFDKLIGITLEISKSEDGLSYAKKGNEFSLDSDSDEGDSQVNVKSTFLDEKASAIHAMGQFANSCPMKFADYFQQALAILEDNFNYFNDNVRKQSLVCYRFLIEALVKCQYGGELPKYKTGLPCVTRLPQNIDNIICIEIWQKFLYYLGQEKNAEIVAIAIDSIDICVKKIGPAYIDVNLDDLVTYIIILLEGRGICQGAESEDEDEVQDEETIGKVFESVVDLIPTLGKVLGEGFQLSFTKIHEPLMEYLDKERDINDIIQGVGCYAVLFKKCPSLIPIYINQVFLVMIDLIEMGDDELNRNIAFALGIVAEKGVQYVVEKIPYIMLALKNIFDRSKMLEARDNAAAALCRVICSYPNQVPIEQALNMIFPIAPFQGDDGEEKTLLRCLIFLAETNGDLLQPHIVKVSMILIDGLVKQKKYKLKQDVQLKIVQLLKALAQSQENKNTIEQLVLQLNETDRQFVIALLQ